MNLFLYSSSKKKSEEFTDPNKALLALDRRTGAHREDYNTTVKLLICIFCFLTGGTDYVMATTSIISGETLFNQLSEHLKPVKLNPF